MTGILLSWLTGCNHGIDASNTIPNKVRQILIRQPCNCQIIQYTYFVVHSAVLESRRNLQYIVLEWQSAARQEATTQQNKVASTIISRLSNNFNADHVNCRLSLLSPTRKGRQPGKNVRPGIQNPIGVDMLTVDIVIVIVAVIVALIGGYFVGLHEGTQISVEMLKRINERLKKRKSDG